VIGGRTALYGIVGWPVGHSLSPAMQNAALAFHALDAVYVAMPVEPARLEVALAGAHALGFEGLNVTIPHKPAAARACVRLDPVASATGAANVLRRVQGGWEGFNTDATAVAELLAAAGVKAGARVLLCGAGGAARAGAWAALRLGASLRVAARQATEAEAVCRDLAVAAPSGPGGFGGEARAVPWADLAAECAAADAILALDMVYGATAFARDAAEAGASVIRGEEMLVRQGAHAFTIWTDRPAPEAVMVAALQRAQEKKSR
jgi:shikimate dehydrogenase